MGSPRCSSTNCEDGTGSTPDKTATATRQRVAPKPVLVGGDRFRNGFEEVEGASLIARNTKPQRADQILGGPWLDLVGT